MSKKHRKDDQRGNIFYFNEYNNRNNRTYSNFLRGSKLSARNQEKVQFLKSRYVDKADAWKLRYAPQNLEDYQELKEQNQQENQEKPLDRQRFSLQSFRPKALSQWISYTRRTIRNSSDPMIISAENSQPLKNIQQERQLPYFSSKNLEAKTNQYLNLILRKSEIDQQEKLRKFFQDDKQKQIHRKTTNIFMRKMKINLKKSKQKQCLSENKSVQEIYKNFNPPSKYLDGNHKIEKQLSFAKRKKVKVNPTREVDLSGLYLASYRTGGMHRKRRMKEEISKNLHIKQLKEKVKQWQIDEEQFDEIL